MESRDLIVPDGLAGQRADAAIARLLGFSRTFAAEVAESGGVRLNGTVLNKADRLTAGGWLEVSWQPRVPPQIEPIAVAHLNIVHDDDDIVVVDKPAGVAAHPSIGWDGPTVLGALAASGFRIATSGASERAGIVHRLDAGTSGLMVVAKNESSYSVLKRAFHDRTVTKLYRALVQGHPDPQSGTIDAPIGRHPGAGWKFAITADGRPSVTHYDTIEAFRAATLLAIRLETGRTHQIRVHLAAQRHPCVGDAMYGADPKLSDRLEMTRQWLHASQLGFAHPSSGEQVHFDSPDPQDLRHALEVLGRE